MLDLDLCTEKHAIIESCAGEVVREMKTNEVEVLHRTAGPRHCGLARRQKRCLGVKVESARELQGFD